MRVDPAGEMLSRNLEAVRGRIAEACRRVGRSPNEVTLVAVTKTVDPPAIEALASLGVRDVGENRVQVLADRAEHLAHLGLNWHMIGHLQRNKVRRVVPLVTLIHSVDSLRLAQAIDRAAADGDRPVEVLIQVNVSGEAAKFGVPADEAETLVRRAGRLPHLRVVGLMTMAPFVDDPETVRPVFTGLRDLADRIRAGAAPGAEMTHLSMGMTQDYVQAVEEGATIVRIGSAIFAGVT